MTRVVASAPGKINLALLVGEVDESGYHPLSSVFEGISLREYVEVEELAAATAPSPIGAVTTAQIEVHTRVYSVGPGSREPRFDPVATQAFAQFDGPGHLAVRAAQLLANPGVLLRITVHKTLPVAGGMAGGSADAAATLVAMNALASDPVAQCDLERLGRTLGADVPACLVGGIALGLGRGDHMEQLDPGTSSPSAQSRWWVAVFSDEGLSTPAVFNHFDAAARAERASGGTAESDAGRSIDPRLRRSLLAPGTEVASALVNDLQSAAFSLRPDLAVTARVLDDLGVAWMMSGSGPTLVALVDSEESAGRLARLVEGLSRVSGTAVMWGPTEGARLEETLPKWCASKVAGVA